MMHAASSPTAGRIVAAGRRRIVHQGYSGFSFADLAIDVGIRKPSIHHHFPSKADLVVAVIDGSRATIEAQAEALSEAGDPHEALRDYAGHWERCITEGSEPFCLAGVLAAEMPNLPAPVAQAVRAHFAALERWLCLALALGVRQSRISLSETPEKEAQRFMATVYGAMLAARVFAEPARFASIVTRTLHELLGKPLDHPASGTNRHDPA